MKRVLLAVLLCTLSARANTTVGTNITADTTWTLAGSPYILAGVIAVGSSGGATLTIEPGVVVKCNAGSQLLVNHFSKGALVANGTAQDPILFQGNGSTTPGYWYGIYLGTVAAPPASSLSYVTVEHGGSNAHSLGGITTRTHSPGFDHVTVNSNQHAGIRIDGGAPSITSSVVNANAGYGIYLSSGDLTLTSVAFTDNTGIAVSVSPMTQLHGMTGLSASGNGTNAVEIRDGVITANRTWRTSAIPYVVNGSVFVQDSSSPVLTIEAGNTVRFNASSQIGVNYQNKGALVANGTSTAPVLFTSSAASPTAGAWWGLYFGAVTGSSASSISHATIEYGGLSGASRGGVTIYTGSPAFDHVTIRNSAFAGAAVHGGSPSFAQTTIDSNGGPGIYAINTATLTLSDVTLTDNSGYAVTAPATATFPSASNLSASGNGSGRDAIEIRAGTMTASTTWPYSGIPWVLTGTIDVMHSSAPVLTIAAGNTIRFNSGAQLSCNHSARGAIQAIGTASEPILFTSNGTATPGYWQGLWFGPSADGPQSNITHATIEYGGSNAGGRGGATVHTLTPVFDHVTFRDNAHAGLRLISGSAVLLDSTITANGGHGINASGGTSLTLTNVAFTNNSGFAATLPVSVGLTDATNLTATGNSGGNAIEYRAGVITANTTWPLSDIPYVVTGTIDVMHSSAPVLTIAAGNTIRFNGGAQLSCNHSAKGAIQAVGTSAQPILFTSNTSAVAGAWQGLWFGPAADGPQSNIAYATIEYGGSISGRGGATVHTLSPVFEHVTFRNNAHAGVRLNSGSAAIRDSTITGNAGSGIYGYNGTGLTLTNVAFTNNDGYAASLPLSVVLADASGLTASGNGTGRDGIEYRGGTITADTTWPASAIPYIVTGTVDVMHSSAPVLTVAAGNTIRFNNGAQLSCNHSAKGALRILGTPGAPVLLTSNGAATAGYWQGLWFGPTAEAPQSNLSYVTVEYGGGSFRGGITVHANAPQFDHLILRNNSTAGLVAEGGSRPRITNTYIHGNPVGVQAGPNAIAEAPLNYWNAAGGPCVPGSCATGQQSATTGVKYEPFLTSPPSGPQYLVTALQKDRAFSPAIEARTTVDYSTSLSGDVAVTIRDASNTLVRSFNSSGTTGSFSWDGKNDSGVLQPDGTYTYEIAATAASQPPASIAKGLAIVDSTRTLTLSNPAVSFAFFSPNADAVQDTAAVTATTNYDGAMWTVRVLDASSNLLRSANGTGSAVSYVWHGKNDSGAVQSDGVYTLQVDVQEGTATQQKSAATTLDNTPPSVAIATPVASDVISNIHRGGATLLIPTGTVTDANLSQWTLQRGNGASPTSWTTFSNGTSPVVSANLGSWETAQSTNGTYALRLLSTDKAGNAAGVTTTPLTIGNYSATANVLQFNPSTNGTITYSSIVPFPLTQTLVVKNAAGTVVRTLVDAASRNAGTYDDVWNGRDEANVIVPDGPYFYFVTVTEGASTLEWDLSNVFHNDFGAYNDGLVVPAYDPFNNKPMTFNYNFSQAALVSIATSIHPGSVVGDCATPTSTFYCPVVDLFQEAGPQTFTWSGIDHTGAYRPIRSVAIVSNRARFPKNAVVAFGSRPRVTNVKVTPPVFGPAVGTQAVEFDLTTFQSQPADVSITFRNLTANSILRTITAAQQSAGHNTLSWDGRADNGMLVAPGAYVVTVTVTDALGNTAIGQILTTIQY